MPTHCPVDGSETTTRSLWGQRRVTLLCLCHPLIPDVSSSDLQQKIHPTLVRPRFAGGLYSKPGYFEVCQHRCAPGRGHRQLQGHSLDLSDAARAVKQTRGAFSTWGGGGWWGGKWAI